MTRRHFEWKPYVMSAVLPLIILILAYASMGALPFTSGKTLLIVDMNQQYYDFYTVFHQTFLHNQFSNIFYSFSNGMGSDMWGIWAYYLFSPLNFVLLLFKQSQLTNGIWVLMALKYMTASMSMTALLRHHGVNRKWVPLFATIYAMNGWAAAYQLNLMWLDALIVLPLLILGIDLLFEMSSYSLYTAMLAIGLIDNYYMGYMITAFSGLYFIYRWVATKFISWPIRFSVVKDYLISSIAGLLMSVWFWLPTFLQLQSSKASYHTSLKFVWNQAPASMIFKTFGASYSFKEMQTGSANMYVTLPILIFAGLYFFNKRFRLRERLSALTILLILIFSFSNELPALAWQAFQSPIWYPFRFSYLMSFWLVFLAAKQISTGIAISWRKFIYLSIAITLWTGLALILYTKVDHTEYVKISYLIADWVVAIGVLILIRVSDYFAIKKERRVLVYILMLGMLGMSYLHTVNVVGGWTNVEQTQRMNNLYAMKNFDPDAKQTPYRTMFYKFRSRNDYLNLNIRGIGEFSSTTDATSSQFLQNLGISQSTVGYAYVNGTVITDALFGMHSLMDYNGPTLLQSTPRHFDSEAVYKKDVRGNVIRYTNDNALPIAFVTNADLSDNSIGLSGQINHQVRWLNQIAPGKTNVITRYQSLKPTRTFKTINGERYQFLTYKYSGLANMVNYVEEPLNFNNGDRAYGDRYKWYNNGKKSDIPVESNKDIVISVDNQNENTIVIKTKDSQLVKYPNLRLYSIDPNALHKRLKPVLDLNKNTKISYPNSGAITVDATAKDKQMIATSIMYNPNFKITDNGKVVKGQVYNDELLAIPVDSGHHHIVIQYQVKGLAPAFIISAITTLIWIGWVFIDRRKYL